MCYIFTPRFCMKTKNTKPFRSNSHICCKGSSYLKLSLCNTLAPLAVGSRCLVSVRNPFRCASLIAVTAQPFSSRLFFLHSIHPNTLTNKKLSIICNFTSIHPHVLAAHSFLSFIHSSFLVIPAFVSFISFSTPRKSGSCVPSVPITIGTPLTQSPHLPLQLLFDAQFDN